MRDRLGGYHCVKLAPLENIYLGLKPARERLTKCGDVFGVQFWFVTNRVALEDATIQEFLRQIAPVRGELERLILFGSRARGDAKPNSDYDILVVMPEKDRRVIDALYDATMEVLYRTYRLISLKIYRKEDFDRFAAMPTPFIRSVLHDGVRIG